MVAAQTTKNLAQRLARQIAKEPLEFLKTGREQVTPVQISPQEEQKRVAQKVDQGKDELQDKMKNRRLMEAYLRELGDIQREKLFKDLQRRITQGQGVYLEEYPELSIEQKQVLKAQIEAVKTRGTQLAIEKPLIEPTPRKSRRLFDFGKKTQAERLKTRVEHPVPPSG